MKYRNKRSHLHSIFVPMKHLKGILGESVGTFIYFCYFQNTVISKDMKAERKSIPVKKPYWKGGIQHVFIYTKKIPRIKIQISIAKIKLNAVK